MRATRSRQSPAEWEESASRLLGPGRDLPAGRHQFHKERLMVRIQRDVRQDDSVTSTSTAEPMLRASSLLRPAFVLPALALTAACAILAVTVLPGGGGESDGALRTGPAMRTQLGSTTTRSVPHLLNQISLAAAKVHQPTVEPGEYIYIESTSADTFVKVDSGRSSLAGHVLHRRQVWESPDGTKGWLIDPAVIDSPEGETLSLPDEQGNPFKASLHGPSYDYLAKLTTKPDALLAKIYKETKGHGNSPDQEAFTTIGDLLTESYPPADLNAALFKAAAKIPGVVVVDNAQDAVGRSGIAVARLNETSGARQEWIFDKQTHVFLGERSVQVREITESGVVMEPGIVRYTSAITKRAIVGGIRQTPAQSS
ncbi:CU044_5270 family protein [Streptomyces sp. NPDC006173]|uniref:CU044_5270 family protein n=1 Tax=Streptomyces sp. NPDC006173 TaxID=3155349 RepID=UPI0033E10C01